jgi:hypothetical protein
MKLKADEIDAERQKLMHCFANRDNLHYLLCERIGYEPTKGKRSNKLMFLVDPQKITPRTTALNHIAPFSLKQQNLPEIEGNSNMGQYIEKKLFFYTPGARGINRLAHPQLFIGMDPLLYPFPELTLLTTKFAEQNMGNQKEIEHGIRAICDKAWVQFNVAFLANSSDTTDVSILVVGNHNELENFAAYYPLLSEEEQETLFPRQQFKSDKGKERMTDALPKARGIKEYTLLYSKVGIPAEEPFCKFNLYYLHAEKNKLHLSTSIIAKLFEIYKETLDNQRPLLIHCSFGLDQSAVIAYAFTLLHDFDDCFRSQDQHHIKEALFFHYQRLRRCHSPTALSNPFDLKQSIYLTFALKMAQLEYQCCKSILSHLEKADLIDFPEKNPEKVNPTEQKAEKGIDPSQKGEIAEGIGDRIEITDPNKQEEIEVSKQTATTDSNGQKAVKLTESNELKKIITGFWERMKKEHLTPTERKNMLRQLMSSNYNGLHEKSKFFSFSLWQRPELTVLTAIFKQLEDILLARIDLEDKLVEELKDNLVQELKNKIPEPKYSPPNT